MGCENDGLRYRHKPSPSADWSVATVDPEGGSWASLAINASGIPHIAYAADDGTLHYARGAADGSFDIVVVDSIWHQAGTFLWLDEWEGVHVIYSGNNDDPTEGGIRYAYRSPAGDWSTTDAYAEGMIRPYGAAVSSDGIVHVVYVEWEDLTHESNRYLGHLYGRCR